MAPAQEWGGRNGSRLDAEVPQPAFRPEKHLFHQEDSLSSGSFPETHVEALL